MLYWLSIVGCILSLSGIARADLEAGAVAPDFTLKNQKGDDVKLSALKGKYVLLFFYPKDDTPGCTKEACTIRDAFEQFKTKNAVVYGISTQDAESHKEFRAKHKLPYDLLIDDDGKVGDLYKVGTIPIIGLFNRKSVLIGPDGKILKYYKKVDPEKHAAEVLLDIK